MCVEGAKCPPEYAKYFETPGAEAERIRIQKPLHLPFLPFSPPFSPSPSPRLPFSPHSLLPLSPLFS